MFSRAFAITAIVALVACGPTGGAAAPIESSASVAPTIYEPPLSAHDGTPTPHTPIPSPTNTPRPDAAEQYKLASTKAAPYLDPRLVAADPMQYQGAAFWLQGLSGNVQRYSGTTWMALGAQVRGRFDTVEVVVWSNNSMTDGGDPLLKDECYRFYVIGAGTSQVVTIATGVTHDEPTVWAWSFDRTPRSASGFGCVAP